MKRVIYTVLTSFCLIIPFRSAKADVIYWESEYNEIVEKLSLTEESLSDLEEKYEKDTKELEERIKELKKQITELKAKVETLQLIIKSRN